MRRQPVTTCPRKSSACRRRQAGHARSSVGSDGHAAKHAAGILASDRRRSTDGVEMRDATSRRRRPRRCRTGRGGRMDAAQEGGRRCSRQRGGGSRCRSQMRKTISRERPRRPRRGEGAGRRRCGGRTCRATTTAGGREPQAWSAAALEFTRRSPEPSRSPAARRRGRGAVRRSASSVVWDEASSSGRVHAASDGFLPSASVMSTLPKVQGMAPKVQMALVDHADMWHVFDFSGRSPVRTREVSGTTAARREGVSSARHRRMLAGQGAASASTQRLPRAAAAGRTRRRGDAAGRRQQAVSETAASCGERRGVHGGTTPSYGGASIQAARRKPVLEVAPPADREWLPDGPSGLM